MWTTHTRSLVRLVLAVCKYGFHCNRMHFSIAWCAIIIIFLLMKQVEKTYMLYARLRLPIIRNRWLDSNHYTVAIFVGIYYDKLT